MELLEKSLQPLELSEFKNMGPHTPTTNIDIPEKAENRVPTDRHFLIAFGVVFLLLMPFMIHTLAYSDIQRIKGDIDDCGNVCGEKNAKYDQWNCTGQDFTDKTILIDGRCVPEADFKGFAEFEQKMNIGNYLLKGSVIFRLILCSLIAVGVSILVLYIFRFAVGCVVWSMIGCVFILSIISVGIMWGDYADESDMKSSGGGFAVCLICTLLLPCYVFAVYYYRNKIRLVILLITEAAKAIFAMPSIMIVPVVTFFVEAVVFSIFLTIFIYMSTAGDLVEVEPGRLSYIATDTMSTTIFFFYVVFLWALFFISGIQYMIVAGAVSEWYFAKDKTHLDRPVKKSALITYKFHLGTVAFGSLIIVLATIFRMIVKSLVKNRFVRRCLDFILRVVEDVLRFISKRAYILTAMHGQPFLKSGKRAARLIAQNLGDVMAINLIGQLTLGVGKLLIALISVFVSLLLFMGDVEAQLHMVPWIIFIMCLLIGITFFSLFETTIDTIFICFCEDSLLNDGMARPYAMSNELMEFVENSKKAYGVTQETTTASFDPEKSQAV